MLERIRKEFAAAIGLYSLDRKGKLLDNFFEKQQLIGRASAFVQCQHMNPSAVIDGGVLIEARRDLAGVHWHPLARDFLCVSLSAFSR
jgi:hypothetical protein